MYSAASELDIMQDINSNGSIVTKFSRTNKANNGAVNIRGISKNGRALVRQTIENGQGRVYQKNYTLPEDHIIDLLTKGSTRNLMGNLGPNIQMKVVKVSEEKKEKDKKRKVKKRHIKKSKKKSIRRKKRSAKRSAKKKKSIKKKTKTIIKKKSAKRSPKKHKKTKKSKNN